MEDKEIEGSNMTPRFLARATGWMVVAFTNLEATR